MSRGKNEYVTPVLDITSFFLSMSTQAKAEMCSAYKYNLIYILSQDDMCYQTE